MDFDVFEYMKMLCEKKDIGFYDFLDVNFCIEPEKIDGRLKWTKIDKGSQSMIYKYISIDINSDSICTEWDSAKPFLIETDEFLKTCSKDWKIRFADDSIIVFSSGNYIIIAKASEVTYSRVSPSSILLESEGKKLLVTKMGD